MVLPGNTFDAVEKMDRYFCSGQQGLVGGGGLVEGGSVSVGTVGGSIVGRRLLDGGLVGGVLVEGNIIAEEWNRVSAWRFVGGG